MESQMKSNSSKTLTPRMPEGLDLEISHHPLTMKSVVNLIVAMERLKSSSRSESLMSTEFRDENLLNIMMDTIMEGEYKHPWSFISDLNEGFVFFFLFMFLSYMVK